MHVRYITNEKGKKIAVQIPLKQWKNLQKGFRKLALFEELKQSFKEMKQHDQGKFKTHTTKQLLSQL